MKNHEVDPRLIALLDELRDYPARNPNVAAHGRTQFLSEAVSVRDKQRHSLWTIFQHKEQFAMRLIASTLVIAGLLFGGNATVAAAQNDLPNEPLYQLKLLSEDVNLWFVSDPVQQIETLMQQAQIRMQEMRSLASQGVTPPAELAIRAQERIRRALQIAAQLEGASQPAAFQQIQTRLQTQEQLMDQLQQGICTACEPALQQTRDMLQIQLRDVENSLATPEAKQYPNQNQFQNQTQNQLRVTQTPQATNSIITLQGTCTPALDGTGQQNRDGNLPASTPRQQNNQQNNQNSGGTQNGTGAGGGNHQSPGSGGQGGKP